MIFYFSGCGNSKHVAETIAAGLNDTLTFIPEAAREGRYEYELAEGERLGFVFPIYSWAPPKLVIDFVKKLQLKAKPSYVYFAAPAATIVASRRRFSARPWKKKVGSCRPVSACKCLKPTSLWRASNSTRQKMLN